MRLLMQRYSTPSRLLAAVLVTLPLGLLSMQQPQWQHIEKPVNSAKDPPAPGPKKPQPMPSPRQDGADRDGAGNSREHMKAARADHPDRERGANNNREHGEPKFNREPHERAAEHGNHR